MIINKTKEKLIVHNLKECKSVFSKAKGLMFSRKIKDFGLVFIFNNEGKRSLHNIFVFFPIDLIFLDENLEVVELKENFRPFRLYFPKHDSQFIIELPAGSIASSKTELRDVVNFK